MADIEELINTVADQDFSKAGPLFKDVLKTKIDAAMEQEKSEGFIPDEDSAAIRGY